MPARPHAATPRLPAGSKAVVESGADLGSVFDTDVYRAAIVDYRGREMNSNRFLALMSAVILREHPGTTVVTDSVTSNGLTKFITKLGGKHFRYGWVGAGVQGGGGRARRLEAGLAE